MINSYSNVKENNHSVVEESVVRPAKTSHLVRNLNVALISIIVLGSLILGGMSAANDGSALAHAFVATTTATTK
ncbi:hypothetical protein HC026_00445 [Lactobacillus sp. LC28-10]|uniref:Uncharacterized protein n=1 Tax=Secundilactobacillus angelensis TaxID=2722706 RepID=A0ABX1KVX0_9LACO|nr:hypothetical protein [Secundilactobacillus angelensis]MCH5461893.1 hypothetical protein [Secundilactobacillus angelensis]NLR17380.1 hypothetical protein [Secundilactobacillus angelensis]